VAGLGGAVARVLLQEGDVRVVHWECGDGALHAARRSRAYLL
jgi:hypothetical protein